MGKPKKKIASAYEIRLSENAVRNIDEIAGYIAFVNHQPLNAEKVIDAIFEIIDGIEKNPLAFKECPLLRTKSKIYRQATCYKWLVIYKIKGTEILPLVQASSLEPHLCAELSS